jgi:hypothetical protein
MQARPCTWKALIYSGYATAAAWTPAPSSIYNCMITATDMVIVHIYTYHLNVIEISVGTSLCDVCRHVLIYEFDAYVMYVCIYVCTHACMYACT